MLALFAIFGIKSVNSTPTTPAASSEAVVTAPHGIMASNISAPGSTTTSHMFRPTPIKDEPARFPGEKFARAPMKDPRVGGSFKLLHCTPVGEVRITEDEWATLIKDQTKLQEKLADKCKVFIPQPIRVTTEISGVSPMYKGKVEWEAEIMR